MRISAVATLTGWITAEVGRQPWTVFGHLRTSDAVTPTLHTSEVATSLAVLGSVYALIFVFGTIYIYRLLKAGPGPGTMLPTGATNAKRPLIGKTATLEQAIAGGAASTESVHRSVPKWRAQGESNPCFRRERASNDSA